MTIDKRLPLLDVASRTKPPVIQYLDGEWRVWVSYNQSLTRGTYIQLLDGGNFKQVTVNPDYTERHIDFNI